MLNQKRYSCRSWELKGIPCAHGIATLNYLNCDAPLKFSRWYKKKDIFEGLFLLIQLVSSMKMWPDSRNLIVEPSEVRHLIGHQRAERKRLVVRKSKTSSKSGVPMTCSICKGRDHNKSDCPQNPNHKSKPAPTKDVIHSSTYLDFYHKYSKTKFINQFKL